MAAVKYMVPSASPITRGQGHKAVAAAAYRSASRLVDEKYECVHNYEAKSGVIHSEIATPDGAPAWMQDRQKLWNAVEQKEDTSKRRKDAQLAKEFMAPLPRELNEEQQIAAGREWVEGLRKRGLVVDWSLHKAQASDGGDNPHIHAMVVTRDLDSKDPLGFGKKWAGDPSIEPGNRKKSPLDDDKTLLCFKQEYTEVVNRHLEAAGSDVRITHLSNESRGIDAKGGIHKGKHATALEKEGQDTRVAEHNRKIGYDNFMRRYGTAAQQSPGGWSMPPTVERENWHKRFAEWQLLRGSMMAARDASQKSQSNVAAPPINRSESRVDMARHGALLSQKQTWVQKTRDEQSRGPDMSR